MAAQHEPATVFRYDLGARFGAAFLFGLMALFPLGCLVLSVQLALQGRPLSGLVSLLATLFLLPLLQVMWRDMQTKSAWRVEIGATGVDLVLPPYRSFLSRSPAFRGRVALGDIAGVLSRDEAYSTLGITTVVKACALRLSDGRILPLGEDRPVTRTLEYTSLVRPAAAAIAQAAGKPVKRLGMAQGDAGWLGVWNTRGPAWDAAPLSAAETDRAWQRLALTMAAPAVIFLLAVLVRALA